MRVNCESEHGVIRHPADVLKVIPSGEIDELLPLLSVYGDGDALYQSCPRCGGQVHGVDKKFSTWGDVFEWLYPWEPPAWDDAESAAIQW